MFFSSSKRGYFLGIDFGARSIKVVEVKISKDIAYLANYGQVVLSKKKETLDRYEGDYAELLKKALKALLKKIDAKSKKVNVAIPAFSGLVMTVDFPIMTEEELAKAIKYESRKYIPTSLDEVNVSWEIIEGERNEEKKTMKVLLVAAPKAEVQYYDDLLSDINIEVELLELETFSLARLLVEEDSKRNLLLLDIGAKTTNIVLVVNGSVRINRNVDVGGINITNSIADNMKVSDERAREIKESSKNLFAGAMALNFPSVNYIISEMRRVVKMKKGIKLDEVIVAGGTAKMTGLIEYIESNFGVKTSIANPMKRIKSNIKDSSGNLIELDSSYCVAAGLAIHGLKSDN